MIVVYYMMNTKCYASENRSISALHGKPL